MSDVHHAGRFGMTFQHGVATKTCTLGLGLLPSPPSLPLAHTPPTAGGKSRHAKFPAGSEQEWKELELGLRGCDSARKGGGFAEWGSQSTPSSSQSKGAVWRRELLWG